MTLASNRLIRASSYQRRKLLAPYMVLPYGTSEDVWWENNLPDFTDVNVTGSHTLIEAENMLSVIFSGQTASDLSCRLKARTFATGDSYVTRMAALGFTSNYTMMALVFADGTTGAANAATCLMYVGDGTAKIAKASGTLTNLATITVLIDSQNLHPWMDGIFARLTYTAANTFTVQYSADGKTWTTGSDLIPTMTPTHVGVGWSRWGGANEAIASYGPLCKVA